MAVISGRGSLQRVGKGKFAIRTRNDWNAVGGGNATIVSV